MTVLLSVSSVDRNKTLHNTRCLSFFSLASISPCNCLHMQVWSYGFTTVGGVPAGWDLGPAPSPAIHASNVATPASAAAAEGGHLLQGGALPTGYAAAGSHQSHWHVYSPSPAASGPYAPLPINGALPLRPPLPLPGVDGSATGSGVGDDYGSVTGVVVGGENEDVMAALMGGEGPAGGPGFSRFRLAGLGFGLPLSRQYARFFGGDLQLQVGGSTRARVTTPVLTHTLALPMMTVDLELILLSSCRLLHLFVCGALNHSGGPFIRHRRVPHHQALGGRRRVA